jgi:hypothetical protein
MNSKTYFSETHPKSIIMNSKLYVAFLVALMFAMAVASPDPVPEDNNDAAEHDAHAEPGSYLINYSINN